MVLWSDCLISCDYGFSVSAFWCPLATPTILLGFLLPRTWGISSLLLQQSAAAAPYLGWGVRSHTCTPTVCVPNPATGSHRPSPSPETPGSHRQVSYGITVPFPGSWCTRFCCALRVYFSVLGKFWQLYSGVNGDILQEDLCHTHTQSPSPCGRALPTHASTGDAQTQFCLSLCGVPGSWCAQGLFEPSEQLWQEQGLILNANRCSCFLAGASLLPLDVGYLLTAVPVPTILLGFFWPWSGGCAALEQPAAKRRYLTPKVKSGSCTSLDQLCGDTSRPGKRIHTWIYQHSLNNVFIYAFYNEKNHESSWIHFYNVATYLYILMDTFIKN